MVTPPTGFARSDIRGSRSIGLIYVALRGEDALRRSDSNVTLAPRNCPGGSLLYLSLAFTVWYNISALASIPTDSSMSLSLGYTKHSSQSLTSYRAKPLRMTPISSGRSLVLHRLFTTVTPDIDLRFIDARRAKLIKHPSLRMTIQVGGFSRIACQVWLSRAHGERNACAVTC